jgi:hypothetical protein
MIVFGDMGRHGGGQILRALKKELLEETGTTGTTAASSGVTTTDAVIHIGDFGYDLQSDDGLVGDTFLQRVQGIASRMPYMTCPGNHEIQGSDENSSKYFAHYRNRFTMPRGMGSSSGYSGNEEGGSSGYQEGGHDDDDDADIDSDGLGNDGSEMWYSWDQGPVHFVSYSTEHFFAASRATQQRMIEWVRTDLVMADSAAGRAVRPWIVTFGHR